MFARIDSVISNIIRMFFILYVLTLLATIWLSVFNKHTWRALTCSLRWCCNYITLENVIHHRQMKINEYIGKTTRTKYICWRKHLLYRVILHGRENCVHYNQRVGIITTNLFLTLFGPPFLIRSESIQNMPSFQKIWTENNRLLMETIPL